jgi:hypothetical protein
MRSMVEGHLPNGVTLNGPFPSVSPVGCHLPGSGRI